ncbi:unnamed protein product, partial [Staurois parvus]
FYTHKGCKSNNFSFSLTAFLQPLRNTLVTWYKAVHSQISQVVSNDVRRDILLTTIHVITDWSISDHMIGTSHRGPKQRSVFPGSAHRLKMWVLFM